MIQRPPRSTLDRPSAASDVYKRQVLEDEPDLRRVLGEQLLENGLRLATPRTLEVGKLDDGDHRVVGPLGRRAREGHRLDLIGREALLEGGVELRARLALAHVLGQELRRWLARRAGCLLYTSPSPRDRTRSRMPSSA